MELFISIEIDPKTHSLDGAIASIHMSLHVWPHI